MFHRAFMPSCGLAREGRPFAAFVLAFFVIAALPLPAQALRFASLNACTDQLLLALADPDEIVGLSPYARDAARSFYAARATAYPRLSGGVEDVLVAKPDVVLTGRFMKRETRNFLKDKGFAIVELDRPRTIAATVAQIRATGTLLGHPDRAEAAVARIEAAATRLHEAAAPRAWRVLPVARRGWVSGSGDLLGSMLAAAGLSDAAADIGRQTGGFVTLEAIVAAHPDLLLLEESYAETPDQGAAFLVHPALQRLYPSTKRLTLPERLTVCAGPMLAEALDALRAEIARLEP